MPMAIGALAQDGGVAVDNVAASIPDQESLTRKESSSITLAARKVDLAKDR